MVTRKQTPHPKADLVPAPLSHAANNPPYPLTPSSEVPPVIPHEFTPDPDRSPAFNIKTPEPQTQSPPQSQPQSPPAKKDDDDKSVYSLSESEWERSDDEDSDHEQDLPGPLKIGGGKPAAASPGYKMQDSLPDVLKVKTPPGAVRKTSWEKITPEPTGTSTASWGAVSNSSNASAPLQTNNPYLRMQTTGQSNFGMENSQQAWGDVPSANQKYGEMAELPATKTPDSPINHLANLSLHTNHAAPKPTESLGQPPLIAVESPTPLQTPASASAMSPRHDSNASEAFDPGMDISSIDAWARTRGLPTEPEQAEPPKRTWQEQQEWEKNERLRVQRELGLAQEAAAKAEQERAHEEAFHREEAAARQSPPNAPPVPQSSPPPPPQQHQPPVALPPITTGSTIPADGVLESPTAVKKRKEHYPIKHIRWYDATARQVRESPILTQNINGPCPLLALVNALVLSTPLGLKTEFVETLRTREQVSLGLLVDAVIEELMSGRRGTELGDINELYKFLIGLHTGMNVNPMFVRDPDATDGSAAMLPTSNSQIVPGGFENTRDMRMYRTFNVPLLHGWLPEPGSEAYNAFDRVAKTYETSQLVQFQEEELDAKLASSGLNAEEQQLFTDIHAIKAFLARWPTQLTPCGLKSLQAALQPGQVAILFRNDHFSTLYKNPHTGELMTLVTDQGYASHDEIVWESLVDVSGRDNELYSGDFRAVGNNTMPQRQQQAQQAAQSLLDVGGEHEAGWTTVGPQGQRRHGNNQHTSSSSGAHASQDAGLGTQGAGTGGTGIAEDHGRERTMSAAEQADADFALALQLQEEEEDRQRREIEERRRRENALSESLLSSPSSQPNNQSQSRRSQARQSEYPPLIPPRRNTGGGGGNTGSQAPMTNRPVNSNDPAPPPTYEEAATIPQFLPPQGHPASPTAPISGAGVGSQAGQAARWQHGQGGQGYGGGRGRGYGGGRSDMGPNLPPRPGRAGRPVGAEPGPEGDKEKCAVM